MDSKDCCKGHLNKKTTWINHVEVRRLCKNFVLSNRKLQDFMKILNDCIDQGLGKETHPTATIKCYQTYVHDMPTGNECGNFLALDLGGSNFRVLRLELGTNNFFKMEQKIFACSKELMTGPGHKLFDYIAKCLEEFINSQGIKSNDPLPLGFTFSFPMLQSDINSGILVKWTKGFTCEGVAGKDIAELLTNSIKKIPGLNIKVCAVLNDTVGTLMSCAWKNPKTRIGLIIGTGCNCCYIENVCKIKLYKGEKTKEEMVINLEWGALGDNNELTYIHTLYDKIVDQNSENPKQQIFEKMISGMYLGELLRLLLKDLIKEGLIFDGKMPSKLNICHSLTTEIISQIENDPPGTYTATRKFFKDIEVESSTDGDCMNVRYAAECVSRRSANLIAAGLSVILKKMNKNDVTIGVDGSVYRYHPHYHKLLVDKIKELTDGKIKFDLMLSEDGSGRGAAVLASAVCK